MPRFLLCAALATLFATSSASAFEGKIGANAKCRGVCDDGRCEKLPYLPYSFRYYAQSRQLGPNPYMYWKCPQCAEDQYGYRNHPAFTFWGVPGTHNPILGAGEGEEVAPNYISQHPGDAVRR